MGKFVDLTGQKFGKLTAIERKGSDKHRNALWLCKCECGDVKVVRSSDLKSGAIMSCGCLRSEQMKEKWQDKDYRKMQSEKMKEKWQDKDYKKKKSNKMKEKWQDEEMKWKMGYKGGISTISIYLRNLDIPRKWCTFCQYEANYTCQLTGKHGGNLNTHHLKAFSTIVIEAHQLHDIDIKPQVKDYTQEELKLLEEYVGSWHKDNTNAVVLSEDVHKLFHSLYGKGENTPEQFEEFKERYMAGEFKEILK